MSLLANYYAAMDEEKRAQTAQGFAQAGLIDQQAGQVGANAQATRDLQAAQAGQARAGAANQTAAAGQVGANAASERALNSSRANQNDVNASLAPSQIAAENALKGAQTAGLRQTTAITGFNSAPTPLPTLGGQVPLGPTTGPFGVPLAKTGDGDLQGFSKGGKVKPAAVQGKSKPGPTDTVPTMLTPGEAVLNKGAVGHYGSEVIDHMNKMGLMRMGAESEHAQLNGLPDPHLPPAPSAKGMPVKPKQKEKA